MAWDPSGPEELAGRLQAAMALLAPILLVSWLEGGPTNLANLALLCRAHHRAVHEGGWQLTRGPNGRFTATGPHRPHRPHR